MLPVAIILLAAGGSSRLGRPKQLLACGDGTLLRRAAQAALAADLGPVFVVLGAAEPQCRETLRGLPLSLLVNPTWHEGMGGSIAVGARALDESIHRSAIIMLCDQPAITPETLRALDHMQHASGRSIVACRYHGTLGPPAFFTNEHFSKLRLLHGHQGAKSLLQSHSGLATLDCPEAALDIDTEAEATTLRSQIAPL